MKKIFFCFCAVSLGLMFLAVKDAENSKKIDAILVKEGKQYGSNVKIQPQNAIATIADFSDQQLAGGYLAGTPYTDGLLINFK